jgi:hypothetical protein
MEDEGEVAVLSLLPTRLEESDDGQCRHMIEKDTTLDLDTMTTILIRVMDTLGLRVDIPDLTKG